VAREAARAAAAEVTWHGALPAADAALGATLGDGGALAAAPEDGATAAQPAMLELWPPPPCAVLPSAAEAAAADGAVVIEGVIALRAYVYSREPFSRAAADLKVRLCDIARLGSDAATLLHAASNCWRLRLLALLQADAATSLAARLEVLIEEAERVAEAAADAAPPGAPAPALPSLLRAASAAPPGGLALPRRVALPWRAGTALCDYALPGEPLEAAAERAAELLGASAPLGAPFALETEAGPAAVAKAAPRAAKPRPDADAPAASSPACIAAASAVALLATAVGYMAVR
jgi:hypothetical protein